MVLEREIQLVLKVESLGVHFVSPLEISFPGSEFVSS